MRPEPGTEGTGAPADKLRRVAQVTEKIAKKTGRADLVQPASALRSPIEKVTGESASERIRRAKADRLGVPVDTPSHLLAVAEAAASAGQDAAVLVDQMQRARLDKAEQRQARAEFEQRRSVAVRVRSGEGDQASRRPDDARPPPRVRVLPGDHRKQRAARLKAQRLLRSRGVRDADPVVLPTWALRRLAYFQARPHEALTALGDSRRARAVRRAAEAAGRFALHHPRAANVCALAAVIWELAPRTTANGMERVLAGVGLSLFAEMLGVCRNTVANKHHGRGARTEERGPRGGIVGDFRDANCGYVEALRQCGFFFVMQPDAAAVPAWQVGSSGFSFSQYRFPLLPPEGPDPPGLFEPYGQA